MKRPNDDIDWMSTLVSNPRSLSEFGRSMERVYNYILFLEQKCKPKEIEEEIEEEKRYQCCDCEGIVKDSEKRVILDKSESERLGVEIHTLACPYCENITFFILEKGESNEYKVGT